jgi:hypothetical protein
MGSLEDIEQSRAAVFSAPAIKPVNFQQLRAAIDAVARESCRITHIQADE